MRRRLRKQRRARDALLLELGALVYELHRQGKRAPELLQRKAAELTGIDEDVRYLEEALGGEAREWGAVEDPQADAVDMSPHAEPEAGEAPSTAEPAAVEADRLEPAVREGEEPRT